MINRNQYPSLHEEDFLFQSTSDQIVCRYFVNSLTVEIMNGY
jgi:hypothetical protein